MIFMHAAFISHLNKSLYVFTKRQALCPIELPNVQGSDTRKDESSNAAWKKIILNK